MELKGVSLSLTDKCNAKCLHCINNSNPKKKTTMEPKDAERYFNQLKGQPLQWVYFIEEPFLYYDKFLEIVRLAKNTLNVPVWVETNGFWGRTKKIAHDKLSKLKDAGLTHFSVEIDAFHQKYVPIESVSNTVVAAKELGFEYIAVGSSFLESPKGTNKFDIATRELLSKIDLSGVEPSQGTVWMIGRAAETLANYKPCQGIPQRKCQLWHPFWIGKDLKNPTGIVIDSTGMIILCQGISIGNAKTKSLPKILEDYDYSLHPIIKILAEEGPKGLLALAREQGYVPRDGYVDECHLCYETRKFLTRHYPDYLAPQSYYEEI